MDGWIVEGYGERGGWVGAKEKDEKEKEKQKKKKKFGNEPCLPSFLCFVCVCMSLVSLLSLGRV